MANYTDWLHATVTESTSCMAECYDPHFPANPKVYYCMCDWPNTDEIGTCSELEAAVIVFLRIISIMDNGRMVAALEKGALCIVWLACTWPFILSASHELEILRLGYHDKIKNTIVGLRFTDSRRVPLFSRPHLQIRPKRLSITGWQHRCVAFPALTSGLHSNNPDITRTFVLYWNPRHCFRPTSWNGN